MSCKCFPSMHHIVTGSLCALPQHSRYRMSRPGNLTQHDKVYHNASGSARLQRQNGAGRLASNGQRTSCAPERHPTSWCIWRASCLSRRIALEYGGAPILTPSAAVSLNPSLLCPNPGTGLRPTASKHKSAYETMLHLVDLSLPAWCCVIDS